MNIGGVSCLDSFNLKQSEEITPDWRERVYVRLQLSASPGKLEA